MQAGLFTATCVILATAAPLAAAADRITAVTARAHQLVLTLEEGGEAVLAHVVLPSPARASEAVPSWLGRKVQVREEGVDRYGRKQVVLTDTGPAKAVWQEQLLHDGLALVYVTQPFARAQPWLGLEQSARAARRGVFGGEACDLHLCVGPEAAQHSLQQFAVVGGRVTRTYKGRDAYYINFGEDWRTDFSLMIPRKAWKTFGDRLTVADGAFIRARGTVISENGPMIVITRPEQMKVE